MCTSQRPSTALMPPDTLGVPNRRASPSRPIHSSARIAFGITPTPAPISPNAAARSRTSTSQPTRRNDTAAASPPIPPPTTIAFTASSSTDVEDSTPVDYSCREMGTTVRKDVITDAAIQLVAEQGMRGLTHRAVDRRAGLPEGSTSAYFRTRKAL